MYICILVLLTMVQKNQSKKTCVAFGELFLFNSLSPQHIATFLCPNRSNGPFRTDPAGWRQLWEQLESRGHGKPDLDLGAEVNFDKKFAVGNLENLWLVSRILGKQLIVDGFYLYSNVGFWIVDS